MSVCLSVRTEQLNYDWSDFREVFYLRTFQKSVEKIQDSLQSDKNVHSRTVCKERVFPF